MLTVAVLGPVEVRFDGQQIQLPAGRSTEVLVRLALDAGLSVRADRILEDLWATSTFGAGKNTLQSKVSQLRRALGQPALITSNNGGYLLDVDRTHVDALRFVDVAAATTELLRSGQLAAALTRSAEGLALFRGEALVDVGDGAWLHPHRERLGKIRLDLLQDNLAARVQLGRGNEVIGELEGLVRQYPLRENLWYWLITALYRDGRQADALAAYTRVRTTLIDELGLPPGPDLQELEKRILDQDPGLSVVPDRDTPTAATAPAGNLPGLSSPLVGREHDVDDLLRSVRDQRLVTLVGTPGVGKTRLAIEVARKVPAPGGTWLVRLDTVDGSTPLPQAVAELLNLPSEQALIERLAAADTFLVLDNCEHIVDAVADLVSQLLDANNDLHVLATSQRPLGLEGESVYPLEPLTIADSVLLFTSRANQVRPRLAVDDATSNSIATLCLSLDGLPLAIELAAARAKSLSVQEISRRLDDRFAVLQDPTSRRPERRRALGAAIGWSYDLLFPDDKRGLWALSCFAGGAPLTSVEHVLAVLAVPRAVAVDVVDRLVDRSLVHADISGDGIVRYRLLDSIRTFAAARLAESPSRDDAAAAHARWYAERADECAATIRGPRQSESLDFVRQERANIDVALAWAALHDPALGVRIVNGFGWAWVVLGDGIAGAARIRAALAASDSTVQVQDRTEGLLLAGWLEASAGDLGRADSDLDQAWVGASSLGSAELTADVQRHRAFLRLQQGRPTDALTSAEQSVAVDRPLGRTWEEAAGLLLAGYACIMVGDAAGASAKAQVALTLLDRIGDSWGMVHGTAMLGAIARAGRQFHDAARYLSRAAQSSQELGFLGQAAFHLTTLGRVQQQSGDPELAAATLTRAIAAAEHDGDRRMKATASVNLARVLRETGRQDAAISLLEQTNRWYRQAGGGDGALLTRVLLASTSHPDASSAGRSQLESAVVDARQGQEYEAEILALDALARMAAQRGALADARELLNAADRQRLDHPTVVDDVDRIDAQVAQRLMTAAIDESGPMHTHRRGTPVC